MRILWQARTFPNKHYKYNFR